jgi:hypothetical protein
MEKEEEEGGGGGGRIAEARRRTLLSLSLSLSATSSHGEQTNWCGRSDGWSSRTCYRRRPHLLTRRRPAFCCCFHYQSDFHRRGRQLDRESRFCIGWLDSYHGNRQTDSGGRDSTYQRCFLLFSPPSPPPPRVYQPFVCTSCQFVSQGKRARAPMQPRSQPSKQPVRPRRQMVRIQPPLC